jgi:hypothetical protein
VPRADLLCFSCGFRTDGGRNPACREYVAAFTAVSSGLPREFKCTCSGTQTTIAPARFYSFTDAEENTKEQIQKARSHPWISPEVPIRGFVYDVSTGRLSEVFPDGETVTS